MPDPNGLIFDIRKYSVHDGPGIRTTVFLKGCPLDCWWCHNPESQSPKPELFLRANRCTRCAECLAVCPQGAIMQQPDGEVITDLARCTACGECGEACVSGAREIVGRWMNTTETLAEIEDDTAFYDESGGGVTFSGGEPLLQADFLRSVLSACKAHDIHTALDTSGFAPWETFLSLTPWVDLFLYDVKLMDSARHRQYTGVPNERILDNLRRLSALGKTIFIRVPLIPSINDDVGNLRELGELAASLPGVRQVDLLPYHYAASGKYATLARPYALRDLQPPTVERLDQAAAMLQAYGLNVKIGG